MNGRERQGEKRGLKWKRGKVNGKVREEEVKGRRGENIAR